MKAFTDAAAASWRADGASTDWCTVRAASVVGVRHRLAGQDNDDSFAWAHRLDLLAVAVADGLGSVPGSAAAARRAAAAAVLAALDGGLEAAVCASNEAAEGGGATTLVVALVVPDGTVEVARVGDSSAFVVEPGGAWRELFPGPQDDKLGAATEALPAGRPALEAAATVLGSESVLVLATDGVADPWRDGPTTVAPAITGAVVERPSALQVAVLADFSRQGCHDDRTMLCVWRRGQEDAGG